MSTLQDIMNPEAFARAIHNGLITERAHDDDSNLRVYSYGPKVQFGGLWTPETRNTRGLMLQVPADGDYANAVVIGRGLPKFFTIEQVNSDWGQAKLIDDDENVTVEETPDIPWEEPAIVSEKLNGALTLGYIQPDGTFTVATKGSFGSTEAHIGDRILQRYDRDGLARFITEHAVTPLFEIITPERPHPINYGDYENLDYLGFVDIATGAWTPADATHTLVKNFGFNFAPVVDHKTLRDAVEEPYRQNTEGFVVTVPGHGLYKVKPKEYTQLRRVFYASRPKDMIGLVESLDLEAIHAMESPDEIDIAGFIQAEENEHNRDMLKTRKVMVFEDIIKPIQEKAHDLFWQGAEVVYTMDDTYDRGDFARRIRNHADQKFLFKVYDDVIAGETWRTTEAARKYVLRGLKNTK